MKQAIRLNESDLHKIVKEAVLKTLNEVGDTPKGQFALGAVQGRAMSRPKYNKKFQDYRSKENQANIASDAEKEAMTGSSSVKDAEQMRQMHKSQNRGFDYGYRKGMHESNMRRLINKTVKKVLKESEAIGIDSDLLDRFDNLKETLGADEFCDELMRKMGTDMLKQILPQIEREHEMYTDEYLNSDDDNDHSRDWHFDEQGYFDDPEY